MPRSIAVRLSPLPSATELGHLALGNGRGRWYQARSSTRSSPSGTSGTFSSSCGHLRGGHRPLASGLDHASQCRSRKLRQQNHAAIGMYEELNPITRFQPEMLANGLRYGRLALDGDGGLHWASITFLHM